MRMEKNYDGMGKFGENKTNVAKDPMVKSTPVPEKRKRRMYHYGGGDTTMVHYKGGK